MPTTRRRALLVAILAALALIAAMPHAARAESDAPPTGEELHDVPAHVLDPPDEVLLDVAEPAGPELAPADAAPEQADPPAAAPEAPAVAPEAVVYWCSRAQAAAHRSAHTVWQAAARRGRSRAARAAAGSRLRRALRELARATTAAAQVCPRRV